MEGSDERRDAQRAYVLAKLAAAPDRKLAGSKLHPSAKDAERLGLGAPGVASLLASLAGQGHVTRHKSGKGASYSLTDAGADLLRTLPPPEPAARARPSASKRPKPAAPELPENPNLAPFQHAYLLLQLLSAEGLTLPKARANKIPAAEKDAFELDARLANQLRGKLAARGDVEVLTAGRATSYRLTDAGRARLATLRHHPAARFTVSGGALNELLDVARGAPPAEPAAAEPAGGAESAAQSGSQVPADLGRVAYDEFRELLRERHSRDRLVPIYELRRQIASKYGAAAARHDALDGPILQLWRQGRVRVISISDLRNASADELADSISDNYETLFYMKEAP